MAGRKWKKGIKCQKGYVDDGKGNCVKVHELTDKYHIKGPTSMPTGGGSGGKRRSLSSYDGDFSVDYNRRGGKVGTSSKAYRGAANIITGRD
tara:strand:- start:5291 stop:5566 length:276 start_codon:yes stop_codon:yes gene_type:complete